MKKLFILLPLLMSAGCASMIQGMGGATAEEVTALKAEVAELRALLAETETMRSDMVMLKAAFQSVQGSLDNLPKETIRRIAEILQRSVSETPRPAATQPSSAPPATVPAPPPVDMR